MTLHNLDCNNLYAVINRLEIGLIVLDGNHLVLHWNRWLAVRSGHTPEQANGQRLENIFPEVDGSRLTQAIEHAIRDGLPSLLSPALHGTLLPLYQTADDRRQARRMQQLIHVLPLRDEASHSACLIQISDMTATISRERLLRQQAENLRRATSEDPLTHLPNRRKFDEVLARECRKAQTRQMSIAVAIADIDLFNDYNAMYGRECGNQALTEMANIFRSAIRPAGDLVARYGGEEFAFILPGMGESEACRFAENLRLRVASLAIANECSSVAKYLSISIGITVTTPDSDVDTQTLISSADVALYQAKHEGRNQAVCFSIDDISFKTCG